MSKTQEKFSQRRRLPKMPLLIIAVLIGFGGTYAIVRSLAATTTTTTAQLNCFPSPHTCGYPDATNTGLSVPVSATPNPGLGGDMSKLTPSGSITVTQDNTTIQNMHVTGTISIQANNVTIKNTLVTYAGESCGTQDACGNSAIQVGTAGDGSGIPDTGYTNVNIDNVETAPALGSNGKVTATCEHDIRSIVSVLTVDSSYLHACDSNLYSTKDTTFNKVYGIAKIDIANDHIENIYFNNSKFTLTNSTLLNPVEQTAVIFGNVNTGGGGACQNTLNVDNSLLAGGGYLLYPCGNASGAGSSKVSITNNRFARCFGTPNHNGNTVCDGGSDTHGYYPYVGSYDLLTDDFNTTWTGNILDDNGQTCTTNASNSCAKSPPNSGGGGTTTTDTTAPSTPSGVTANATSSTKVSLSWSASTDNSGGTGVAGYNVFRNGTQVNSTTVPGTTYQDTNLSPATAYQYTVQAVDNAGNKSSMSSSGSATTLAAQTGGTGGGTTGGGTSCTPATSSATLTSAFNSAASGTVICLAAGSYSFSGGLKTGTSVTIQPQDGVTKGQVTMTVNFSAASGITINGVTVNTGSVISGSKTKNITIENSDFPGQITLDASTLANANILFNNNVHHDFNATGDQEGRIFVPGGDGRPTVGITIENSQFLNGNSDGIQNGANGLHIGPGNVFSGIVQVDSSSGVHADSIQLYGSQNTTIEGNYFHNDEDGIMCADGCDHEVVKNNVFAITGSAYAITWLSDNGSSITHNTFVNGSSCSYGPCGILKFGNKSSDPVSTGTTLKDNVLTSWGVSNGEGTTTGLASGAEGYNLLVNNPKAGPPSPSSTDIIGSPTYVGGANPSNYAGYALACGSLGKGNASDGTDRGINVAGASGSCGGGTGSDTQPPTVSMVPPPANGATVSGVTTFTANANDNVGVTKVEFYIDNASSPAFTANTPTNASYPYSLDTKTLSNGSHAITAKAYDAAGLSSAAAVTVNIQNADSTKPTAPTNVKPGAVSATSVSLSWSASTDPCTSGTPPVSIPCTGVVKYNVVRNDGAVVAQPTTTSYTDTTVVANTSYSYAIQAVDGAGNISANSSAITVKTPSVPVPDTTPPSTPTNVSATATTPTQVTVTWGASTDSGGSGLAGYNIYRDGSKLNSSLLSSTSTSYGDGTVAAGKTYSYVIEAVDGAGNPSAKTSGTSVTTPPAPDTTPPTVPSNVKATPISSTEIDVTWDPSTDNSGSGLAGYNIFRNGTQLNTAPLTGTTYKDVQVSPSTKYQYSIQATDKANNNSDKTSAVSATTPAGPTTGGSNSLLLGSKDIQSSPDSDAAGSPEAFQYTAVASGQANTLNLYIDRGSAATTAIVGIYSDSNGKPGTLLATGSLNSPVSSTWNTITLSSKPVLESGTTYWISLLGLNGTINFRDASSGSCSQSPSSDNLSSLPVNWNTGPLWQTCTVSAYVSSSPASSGGSNGGGGSTGGGSPGGGTTTTVAVLTVTVTNGHHRPVANASVTLATQTVQTNRYGVATFTNVPVGNQSATIQSDNKTVTRSVKVASGSHNGSSPQHVTLSLANATLNPALLLIPVVVLVGAGLIIFRPWSSFSQATAGTAGEDSIVSSGRPDTDTDKPGRKLETPGVVYHPEEKDKQ